MKDAKWNEIFKSQINYCLKWYNLLPIFCASEEAKGSVALAAAELLQDLEGRSLDTQWSCRSVKITFLENTFSEN